MEILFAMCTDDLDTLKRVKQTGVGCHLGLQFSGALVYADHLTLL